MVAFYWLVMRAWMKSLVQGAHLWVSVLSALPGLVILIRGWLPTSWAARVPSSAWLGLIPIALWSAWQLMRVNYREFEELCTVVEKTEKKERQAAKSRQMWKSIADGTSMEDRKAVLGEMCDVAAAAKQVVEKHSPRQGGGWSSTEREDATREYQEAAARLRKARAVAAPGFPYEVEDYIGVVGSVCENQWMESQSEAEVACSSIDGELNAAIKRLNDAWTGMHGVDVEGRGRPWYKAYAEAYRMDKETGQAVEESNQ